MHMWKKNLIPVVQPCRKFSFDFFLLRPGFGPKCAQRARFFLFCLFVFSFHFLCFFLHLIYQIHSFSCHNWSGNFCNEFHVGAQMHLYSVHLYSIQAIDNCVFMQIQWFYLCKLQWFKFNRLFSYVARGQNVKWKTHPLTSSQLTNLSREPPAKGVKITLPTCLSCPLTPGADAIPLRAPGCVESFYRGGTVTRLTGWAAPSQSTCTPMRFAESRQLEEG